MLTRVRPALLALVFALLLLSPAWAVRIRHRDAPGNITADGAKKVSDAPVASDPSKTQTQQQQQQQQQQSGDARSEYSGENVDGQVSVAPAQDPNTDDSIPSSASPSAATSGAQANDDDSTDEQASADADADADDSVVDDNDDVSDQAPAHERPLASSTSASGAASSSASCSPMSLSPLASSSMGSVSSMGSIASTGQASTGQASTGQASTGQASTGQASTGQASSSGVDPNLPPNANGIRINVSPLVYQETNVNVGNTERHVRGLRNTGTTTLTTSSSPNSTPTSSSPPSLAQLRKGEFTVQYTGAADLNNLSRGAVFLVRESNPGHWSATLMNDGSSVNEKGTEMTHVSSVSPNDINIWGHELTYNNGMFYFASDGSVFGQLVQS